MKKNWINGDPGYAMCPYCGNYYKLRVPRGGDGSALIYPTHQRKVGTGYVRKKEYCPGSRKTSVDS